MDRKIIVRDVEISNENVKICVPIGGGCFDDIVEEAKQVIEMHPDIVEWRCDDFAYKNNEEIMEVLVELRSIIWNTPLIFTFRTAEEGGNKTISEDEYKELNLLVAKSGLADFVDVEAYSKADYSKELIDDIHSAGAKVVGSYHDFDKTPEKEFIVNVLKKIENQGADICKIAVMPNTNEDVQTLIEASKEASDVINVPIVTMSMGDLGAVTRVCSKLSKSSITFAKGVNASAPGQIDCKLLRELVEISKNVKPEKNIILIGFMGTGKTTISDALQKITGLAEVDVDKYIVEKEGMSIPEIFEQYGEKGFRDRETEALREIQKTSGKIVSCGGGAVLKEENVEILKENGVIFLLTASPQVILDRVKDDDQRPLLKGHMNVEYIEELMEKRRSKYEAAADYTVDTDCSDRVKSCYDILVKM